MQITPIGWILLPAGFLLAIVRPYWLYCLTLFLLPFTATAVINVGTGDNASGLQASMYLGTLLFLRFGLSLLQRRRLRLPYHGRSGLLWLGIFVAVTGLSLVMPIWIDGRVQVSSPYLLDFSSEPLHFKSSNFTGVLYVLFGYRFAFLIAACNLKPARLRTAIKAFLAGCSFAAFWALLQEVCALYGVQYPAFIFNSSASISARGYREIFSGGIQRLSSVSVEPSILAQTLLIALALYLPFILGAHRAFGKVLDRLLFAVMFVVLLLTTSSTAYIGVVAAALLILFLLAVSGVLRLRHFLVPVAGIVAAGVVYAVTPVAQEVVGAALLSKGGGYSAVERLMTIRNAYQMFLRYPLLGIGWASIASHDLIMNILANCGVVGLSAFIIAMFCIFRALYRPSRLRRVTLLALMEPNFALLIALSITLITCIISGALFVFPFFWFLCGLAIASPDLAPMPARTVPTTERYRRLSPHSPVGG